MSQAELAADEPLRAALIVDGSSIPRWAVDAIAMAVERRRMEIAAVFVCADRYSGGAAFKHFGYRAARALLKQPGAAERQPFRHLVGSEAETVTFSPEPEGSRHRLPSQVLTRAASLDLDVAIEFSAGGLLGPETFPARHGVLSYCHGEPLSSSGRLIGFRELESDAPHVEAGVIRLTSTSDFGEVLAEGRFRIERHSYRSTLESVLSGSSCLLEKALTRCKLPPAPGNMPRARNDQPPGSGRVMWFLVKLAIRKARRLLQGGFGRKAWRLLEADRPSPSAFEGELSIAGEALPLLGKAQFLADPFYLDSDGRKIVCERMPKGAAFGDIIQLEAGARTFQPLLGAPRRHFSYPCVFRCEGRLLLFPEAADWSAPFMVELDASSGSAGPPIALKGLENERLLDPTPFAHDNAFWLFASPAKRFRQLDTLLLFVADHIEGPYIAHPMSPVVVDPGSARPGGKILDLDGRLLRFGQDNTRGYGAGLAVAEIEVLTRKAYRERRLGSIKLTGMHGPHTIDFAARRMVLDGYRDVVDPFAFVGRFRPRPFRS